MIEKISINDYRGILGIKQIEKDITKGVILKICDDLSEKYGRRIDPEPICEGGLVFKSNDRTYKTVRFQIDGFVRWPWIDDNVLNEWRDNPEVIFKGSSTINRGRFFIKAFYGAPCWSRDEILILKEVLEKYGFVFYKSKIFNA